MQPGLRLILCRSGFVLFALLPTIVVGSWIVRRGLPEYALAQRAEWERELSQRLGVTVTIGEVAYLRPSVASLRDVRFSNPETDETIATVPEAEVTHTDAAFAIEASQPIVDVRQLALLGSTLHERLLQTAGDRAIDFEVAAGDLTLQSGSQAVTLRQFTGLYGKTALGDPSVNGEFTFTGKTGTEHRGTLTILRNRQLRPAVTRYELDTGNGPLPCWLLSDSLPQLSQLGPDAEFSGAAVWMNSSEGLSAEFVGNLNEVDFDSLVSDQLLHQLSGLANVTLEPAKIEGGRLSQLRGTVQAHDGWISPSLLSAAAEHLQVRLLADLPESSAQSVPYRQLSIGFDLRDRELLLSGGYDVAQAGVALANAAGPIMEIPPGHSTPAVNLLRMLLPESEWQVPATRQTSGLASLLPVPDLSPELSARRTSHTPTRLGPAGVSEAVPVRQPR
jgi:hypothetical protein